MILVGTARDGGVSEGGTGSVEEGNLIFPGDEVEIECHESLRETPGDGRRNERYQGCINNKASKAESDVFFGRVPSRDNWSLESLVSRSRGTRFLKIPSRCRGTCPMKFRIGSWFEG